ncbi:MAG: hypothetical protein ACRD3Q_08015 [Terriglobales bacterium]
MMKTVRVVGVALAVSVAAFAQAPQKANPPKPANSAQNAGGPQAANNQQANAGAVRNDRTATMPRVGVSASFNPNQNELVGCVVTEGKNLYLDQEEVRRSYQLRGNSGQLQANVGQLVQVTGRLVVGTPPAFEVQQVQVIQPKCNYAQTSFVRPVTGGTGTEGTAFNVSSTASLGQPTPGVETEPGVKQNPSMAEGVANFGANRNTRPTYSESQGAPPDPRMENPQEAERIANSATRSELNNSSQLGVNAQPNYAGESNPQQTQQFTANEAQQQRGQATGSTQVLRGGGQNANTSATANEEAGPGNSPVFTGCIEQRNNKLVLVESATNQMFEVDAQGRNVGSFVNQQVRIVGNYTGIYGPAIGTAGNSAVVHVESINAAPGSCTSRKD